jgi:hypothetical protein
MLEEEREHERRNEKEKEERLAMIYILKSHIMGSQ